MTITEFNNFPPSLQESILDRIEKVRVCGPATSSTAEATIMHPSPDVIQLLKEIQQEIADSQKVTSSEDACPTCGEGPCQCGPEESDDGLSLIGLVREAEFQLIEAAAWAGLTVDITYKLAEI
jgi:hypothetical protein